jgi:hypothetical protein
MFVIFSSKILLAFSISVHLSTHKIHSVARREEFTFEDLFFFEFDYGVLEGGGLVVVYSWSGLVYPLLVDALVVRLPLLVQYPIVLWKGPVHFSCSLPIYYLSNYQTIVIILILF